MHSTKRANAAASAALASLRPPVDHGLEPEELTATQIQARLGAQNEQIGPTSLCLCYARTSI